MKIGYARASIEEENMDIQLKKLRKAGCIRIFIEKETGTKWDRPEMRIMLDSLEPGDIVIVWSLDRLAKTTKMLLELTNKIMAVDAKFRSLSEPWADTTKASGESIVAVFKGLAEFERKRIKERTSSGRGDAIKRGVKFGRPSKLNTRKLKLAQRLLNEGNSMQDIADSLGVHYTTLYRLLREQK